jgi:uncharacterized protein YgiB involved in biofilm formation
MRLIKTLLSLCALSLVAACAQTDAERCAGAKNPAECVQVASAGGTINDYLLYGMAGYMLSSALNGSGQRQPVIVADPGYHGYRRPIASYQHSREHVRRTTVTTTTTTKRGIFGGMKTTTRTTSMSSRPSFSRSSFRSSSFRSGRR